MKFVAILPRGSQMATFVTTADVRSRAELL
jgi:hypothetical protein